MRLKIAPGYRLLAVSLLALSRLVVHGQADSTPPPPLVLRRLAAAPVVDGVPDDACWRAAAWHPLRRLDGGAAAVGGQAAFAYDATNLYVAVRLDEPEPSRIRAPKTAPNAPELWDGEMLEWFVNAAPDRSSYAQLAWNPAGSRFNTRCVADGNSAVRTDTDWAPRWLAAAIIGAQGWSAEATISFAELGVTPPADGTKWSMNLGRTRRIGSPEFSALAPTGGGFHLPERFAEVWFGVHVPETAADVTVAPTNAPLRALIGCWGAMLGYDILIDARPQLERALGCEQVDVRVCNVLDGRSSALNNWPRFSELVGYALVVLADIPAVAFSDAQLADLRNYVEAGGHVVLAGTMAGARHHPQRSWSASLFGPLLPIQPLLEGRTRRTVTLTASEHPLFAGLPATPAFTIWGFRGVAASGAVVRAESLPVVGETNGPVPFIVERAIGRGSVLALNAGYSSGSTGVPVDGLLRGNDFCLSPHYARFWDNLVAYLTGRAAPHPSPAVTATAPSRIWFDIIRDNNGRIFRPDAPLRVATPLAGAADLAFPCEVTVSIESETGAPTIAAGTYLLASTNADVTVTLPGLDRGAYRLRLERRDNGNVVDSYAARFTVALPIPLASDAFPFSVWVAPIASAYDEARIARDLRAIGFDGVSYGGGVVIDGSYAGLLRPYAEARFLSSMQEAGLSTRPCWYPALDYIMVPKTKNYDFTNRQPPTPDAVFPGDTFLPYQFHWMDAYATSYWGRMPLTDGATIGDELAAIRIPLTDRVRKAYADATGRAGPDAQSPDDYDLLQVRLMIGGDIIWLTRAAWEAHSPGSAFDCVLSPNSFAGHASPLLNLYATFSSLGVPSPDEYHYGEPKLYQKTLKSAAIAWSGTEFGRLAKPALTGGQLSNAYYEEFPEQVFAALSAGMHEFHVFHFSCASFERDGRQDPRFAARTRVSPPLPGAPRPTPTASAARSITTRAAAPAWPCSIRTLRTCIWPWAGRSTTTTSR